MLPEFVENLAAVMLEEKRCDCKRPGTWCSDLRSRLSNECNDAADRKPTATIIYLEDKYFAQRFALDCQKQSKKL